MKGNEAYLFDYLSGGNKQFIIPVYQRNYDWKIEHCKQLFDDLVNLKKTGVNSHFFGSIVSGKQVGSGTMEFLIIDGQQRITTVCLLLLALHRLLMENKITSNDPTLEKRILEDYLTYKYGSDPTKIKLKLIKSDQRAFSLLVESGDDHINASNLTVNYNYFYQRIQKQEISADDLFDAFCKLQIIDIHLDHTDNAQLIFESLNSTGLDLNEGDKIRNFILMGIDSIKTQENYYEKYWHKIEKLTNYDVSSFIRDYLSIKLQSTPAIAKVYVAFKSFFQQKPFENREALLIDLLSYAKHYGILIRANSSIPELNTIITRLNRFEATVTRPFFLEILKLAESDDNSDTVIAQKDLIEIFKYVESYLFRRMICDIPTNALNKIFVALNREIINFDDDTGNYLEKFKFALLKKSNRGLFPRDEVFAQALSSRHIYNLSPKNKKYLFERFENWDTAESKDVWEHIENNTYTIEHIMPQTLTNEWTEALGSDYKNIHETWLHRLANLTLTAYNTSYSNKSFIAKRDAPKGFRDSGIRMNQKIARLDKWTLQELVARNQKMTQQALSIWLMVKTDYSPPKITSESFSLADESDLTGKRIERFFFRGNEQESRYWKDMFVSVLTTLHEENPNIMFRILEGENIDDAVGYLSDKNDEGNLYSQISDGVFFYTNLDTNSKLAALRKFFKIYGVNEDELTFEIQEDGGKKASKLGELRLAFWEQALPIIANKTGKFINRKSGDWNWYGSPAGFRGVSITIAANAKNCSTSLTFERATKELNKHLFDYLYKQKARIEAEIGQSLRWHRLDDHKMSQITVRFIEINLYDKTQWDYLIEQFVENVNKIQQNLMPFVEDYFRTLPI